MKLFFFLFHLTNLALLLSLVLALAAGHSLASFLPYFTKCVIDSVLFVSAASKFNEMRFASRYLLMEVMVILYNSLIGPLGFIRRFDWKPEVRS